jgi:aspartate racemase
VKQPSFPKVVSLIEPLLEYVEGMEGKRCLLLSTTGMRVCGHYSGCLKKNGLKVVEPEEKSQELVMQAIYEGIKAGDEEKTLLMGSLLFQEIFQQEEPFDFVICACTEIPLIIDILRKKGGTEIHSLLEHNIFVDLVDFYFYRNS